MEQQLRQLLQQQQHQHQHQSQEQQLLQMLQPSFSLLQQPQQSLQQQQQQAQLAMGGGLSQQERDLLAQLHQLRDWAQLAAPQPHQQQQQVLFPGSAPAFQAPRFDASGLLAAPQQAGAAMGGSAASQAWPMAAPAAAAAPGATGGPGLSPLSLQELQRQALLAAGAAAPQAQLQLAGQVFSGPSGASAALPPAGLAPSGGLPSSLLHN